MDQKTLDNKQRIILNELMKACSEYDNSENWIQHFDEAVRIQTEIGYPFLRSGRYVKTQEVAELLRDRPKCHGPHDLVKITPQSIHERHDFIFLMLDAYSKSKHTYSEETCCDLQLHILDVAYDAGWQFHIFCQTHLGSKSASKRI